MDTLNLEIDVRKELDNTRYQVVNELGKGGMGTVYLCRDRFTGQHLALKVLLPPDVSPEERARYTASIRHIFFCEVRAMLSLRHPNIVSIRDYGLLSRDVPFVGMEYVRGYTLDELYKKSPILPFNFLLAIAEGILRGLAFAHSRGIVHFDLKPGNIILEIEGPEKLPRPVLLDFGISLFKSEYSKELERLSLEADKFRKELWSETPPRFISAPYGPPEQIDRELRYRGPASDLYSLGVVLFQFIYGKLPFISRNLKKTLWDTLYTIPPEYPVKNGAPEEFCHFVKRKLMAKNPWERPQFASEVAEYLSKFYDLDEALNEWKTLYFQVLNISTGPINSSISLPSFVSTIPSGSNIPDTKEGIETSSFSEEMRQSDTKILSSPPSSVISSPLISKVPESQEEEVEVFSYLPLYLSLAVPPFVGRKKELRETIQLLNEREPHLIVLRGEAGIGKSRLANYISEYCSERGYSRSLLVVLKKSQSFWESVGEAIENFFELKDATAAEIQRTIYWAFSSEMEEPELFSEGIAEWLRPFSTPNSSLQLDRQEVRYNLFITALSTLAGRYPLLLRIDNFEEASSESFEWLASLYHSNLPVTLLLTVRSEAFNSPLFSTQFQMLLSTWPHTILELNALSQDELKKLLLSLLPIDEYTQKLLYHRSQGNPLLALQHLFAWAEENILYWDRKGECYSVKRDKERHLPKTTQELWSHRIRHLSEEGKLAAIAATTLEDELYPSLLEKLLKELGLEPHRTISELVTHNIVTPTHQQWQWNHPLFWEFLSKLLEERDDAQFLNLKAAEILEHHPQREHPKIIRLKARLLLKGGRPSEAYELIISLIEREWESRRDPLQALNDLEFIESIVPPDQKARWFRWKAEAEAARSAAKELNDSAEEALKLYTQRGDEEGIAHSKRLLAIANYTFGQHRRAQELASEALQYFESRGDKKSAAETLYHIAITYHNQSLFEDSERYCRRSIQLFKELNSLRGQAENNFLLSYTYHDRGLYSQIEEPYLNALENFQKLRDKVSVGRLKLLKSWLLLYQNRNPEALQLNEEQEKLFLEYRDNWWLGVTMLQKARILAGLGLYDEAKFLLENICAQLSSEGLDHELGQGLAVIAQIELAQGNREGGRSIVQKIFALKREEPYLLQHLYLLDCWVSAMEGDLQRAEQSFQKAWGFWKELGLVSAGLPQLLQMMSAGLTIPKEFEEKFQLWMNFIRDNLEGIDLK